MACIAVYKAKNIFLECCSRSKVALMTACLCHLCSSHVEGDKEYWTVWLDGDCGALGGGGLPLRGLGSLCEEMGFGLVTEQWKEG